MLPVSRQIIRTEKTLHYAVENMGTKKKTCGNRAHMNFELEKSLEVLVQHFNFVHGKKKMDPKDVR